MAKIKVHIFTKNTRRRKWLALLFITISSAGLLIFLITQKTIFQKQERKEISQERWLYWCKQNQEIENQLCYYVNRDGAVITEAPRMRGNLFPKLYDERNAGGDKKIIEENLLAFVKRFYDFGQFVVKNDETLEIGWPGAMRVTISLKDNPERVAENLALILEKEIGDRRNEVDYIDLRFGNRVYYKFR